MIKCMYPNDSCYDCPNLNNCKKNHNKKKKSNNFQVIEGVENNGRR
jgi:hypothetical protein